MGALLVAHAFDVVRSRLAAATSSSAAPARRALRAEWVRASAWASVLVLWPAVWLRLRDGRGGDAMRLALRPWPLPKCLPAGQHTHSAGASLSDGAHTVAADLRRTGTLEPGSAAARRGEGRRSLGSVCARRCAGDDLAGVRVHACVRACALCNDGGMWRWLLCRAAAAVAPPAERADPNRTPPAKAAS